MGSALTDDLTRMPAQPVAAVRVLRMVDDPKASAADLARIIETDPALSARVIRLANAPYYGLARKVGSAAHAVVLLGFSTVRALAVSAACGLLSEEGDMGPEGFWTHSIATAASSAVLARRTGVATGDAFSAGLLHDLGSALLFRHAPERYRAAVDTGLATGDVLAAERAEFGLDHAEAGASVLDAWRFPPAFVRAIESHHEEPDRVVGRLGRVVIAAEAISMLVEEPPEHPPLAGVTPALDALRIPHEALDGLIAEARTEIDSMAHFLGITS